MLSEIFGNTADEPAFFDAMKQSGSGVLQGIRFSDGDGQTMKNIIQESYPENPFLFAGQKDVDGISSDQDEPFMVLDTEDIVGKCNTWRRLMPRVEPFYAMKCNDDPVILNILASEGVGFDCASKGEIDTILKMGVDSSRIIYANPCKSRSYIKYAAAMGVNMMTFDGELELKKIKAEFPDAKLIVRIKVDDSSSILRLGAKFGCEVMQVPLLLQTAKTLNLSVVGVSFHVGYNLHSPSVYSAAIKLSKQVFDIAEKNGYKFKILDIGGGFPGHKELSSRFEKIAMTTNQALDMHFPLESEVRIIAEPGRYFVGSALTLYANVIGKREIIYLKGNETVHKYEYFINEGIYGSFYFVMCHNQEYIPIPVKDFSGQPLYQSQLWGPTCDSADKISEKCMLPVLEIGDWIQFNNMGDYTVAVSSTFNGFPKITIKYINPLKIISSQQLNES